jgi:hypothetical protein
VQVATRSFATYGRARLAWSLFALTVLLLIAMVVLSAGREEAFDTILYGLLWFALAGVGTLIVSKHPDNLIGWIFMAQGLFGAFAEVADGWGQFAFEHDLPGGAGGEWLILWSWIVDLSAWTLVFLLFPDGHLPSRRWRAWPWVLGAGLALALPGQALAPGLGPEFTGGVNPLGKEGIPTALLLTAGLTLMLVTMAAGFTALAVRFRRGTSVERQQVKWFAFAASLLLVVGTAAIFLWYESVLIQVLIALALIGLPVGAGISIFKYRLYDIDVVINRTLVYGGLTATLAAFYLASVLVLQLALNELTEGSGLAVAVSTLGAAAIFRPVRARIQSTVDRRFYRRKYDSELTLEGFRVRMRGEVAIDSVSAELQRVVAETMQPAHVSLWLQGRERLP